MEFSLSERAAYMAAAIDGEGHVGIRKEGAKRREWRKSLRFTFVVKITNTNKQWLEQLQRWFGGKVYELNGRTGNRRACYDLRFSQPDAKRLIAAVMPYLIIKRRHAEIALQHFELAAQRRVGSVNAKPTDPELIRQQLELYEEIRSVSLSRSITPNQYGPKPKDRRCEIEGCEKPHYGHGYCWIHYRKYVVRGGPKFYELKCANCGRDFVARRSDTKCCSKACWKACDYAVNGDRIRELERQRKARKRAETHTR